MAMKLTTATADAILSTIATSLNTGYIKLYSGTEPTTADTALSGNTLLADLRFPATAFPSAAQSSGTDRYIDAGTITSDSSADADGTATFFRAVGSNNTTVVYQGKVGVTGDSTAQLTLGSTNIVQTGVVSISALRITMPTV